MPVIVIIGVRRSRSQEIKESGDQGVRRSRSQEIKESGDQGVRSQKS
ncbi:hypothetical protein [Sphaerospermopsis sp. FACHB-1194]|nr:hypothetical protein [Sphaerospermopsis sp. FACHB-1194]MBD2144788.1 hypothetical protein [Sphaerospermopsis sp. FACHB-1194]